jgi:chromate transporter
MAIGLLRAGPMGMLAAWAGFTLPSAVAMALFAYGVGSMGDLSGAGWLHGLKLVAVAVVAQAVWGMARTLAPDKERATLAVLACLMCLAVPSSLGQVGAIALGAVAGVLLLPREAAVTLPMGAIGVGIPRGVAAGLLAAFFVLLLGLPLLAEASSGHFLKLVNAFYAAGSLVFGGGHVVLPLLQHAMVAPGWIGNGPFLAGYGAAQAMPGPLFSFAAFLGTAINDPVLGKAGGATICLVAIYLPSALLVAGGWPLWSAVAHHPALRAALAGTNAMVVGLVAAALYSSVWVGAIFAPVDAAIALAALGLLLFARFPSWAVVGFGAAAATLVARISGA